jgi:hypothetical protein
MRFLILAAALAVPSTVAANKVKLDKKECNVGPRTAGARESVAPRKLGELPPAHLFLTVYREENGCPKPVIVRQNIGSQPRR